MDRCNLTGDGGQGLGQHDLAGDDAIAVSGRGRWMVAVVLHAAPGHLAVVNSARSEFLAGAGIPADHPLEPRQVATDRGRAIPGVSYRPSFIPKFLDFLAGTPGISVTTLTGPGLSPTALAAAARAPLDMRYKAADASGTVIIGGDRSGPPRVEFTGTAVPRPFDAQQLARLLHAARFVAHVARDRHFPNPHRRGMGTALDELLPGAVHLQA
ncbi:hypothetical protein M8Z33_13535 [Streptomyces sp. ZAF1911]|uniref:hypothetical protein n=1 Tax=Streptomyces sp. ZAF1911 TaxID=2944129 RepID=UPI00237AD0CF|nr:hypothetical protein [Streptomyces sp. ZAF1911]MDD9377662.1 hypothetical protein [Streptomyces sp. ZAF1911]